MNSKKAFTLIELLVVIAIIGILATISIIAFSTDRAKARDAKRIGDAKQMKTALEMFFNDQNRFPTKAEFDSGSLVINGKSYMIDLPVAPNPPDGTCDGTTNQFSYNVNSAGTTFALSFCLGGPTGSLSSGLKCVTRDGFLDTACAALNFVCGNSLSYGGEAYPTANIGSHCWMTKNLNIGTRINVCSSGVGCPVYNPQNQTDNGVIEKYCFNDDQKSECDSYGGMYQWGEAMQYSVVDGARGICPAGWHIPEYSEWVSARNTGLSGFNTVSFGYLDDSGSFQSTAPDGDTWLSSVSGPNSFDIFLPVDNPASDHFHYEQINSFSVRCVMN